MPSPRIVGRDDDLWKVVESITSSSAQVLTIIGPGGVGKTRLALTAAWDLADTFDDGVAFIPLTHETPSSVWETIARSLGIPYLADGSWHEAVGQALSSRNMLIVLDDCEHVCDAFTVLPEVISQCPGVMIMATSQTPLQLEIEQELWLRPLDLPTHQDGPDQIKLSSAVRLFALRARRRNPSFEVDENNAADIAAIVHLLDGLPLAIELAAGQTRHFSPAELRQQLERSLTSLASGARDLPERHRSLINMTTWSLNQLCPANRQRFLRLSILENDFTPETAFRIMEIPDIEGWEVLTNFADKSLIARSASDPARPAPLPRFSILQTLQAGARYLLEQEPDNHAAALRRRATVYLEIARDASRDWHNSGYVAAFQTIDHDLRNIEAIIDGARTTPELITPAIELVDPMFWYWFTRNRESWILPRLETILANASEDTPDHARGTAHVAAGWFALRQTQSYRAAWHFREATRYLPDRTDPASLRGAIGEAYLIRNEEKDPTGAIAKLRETVQLGKTRPDASFELSAAYYSLGIHLYLAGSFDEAGEHLNDALKLARASGDHQSIAMNLIYLGQVDRQAKQFPQALARIQEALPILQTGGDISNILLGLDIAIMTIEEAGDSELAGTLVASVEHLRRTWHIQRSPEEREEIASLLHRLQIQAGNPDPVPPEPTLAQLVSQVGAWQSPGRRTTPTSPLDGILSDRELEILYMVADGKTSPQIAAELFVSPHTVKRHMANIRGKLGVRSQAAAVAMLQRDR